MTYSEIEQKVKEILADKLNLGVDKITSGSRLIDDLGVDSFASVEIMFELEEKFGLKIPDEDIVNAKTVKDITDYLNSKLAN